VHVHFGGDWLVFTRILLTGQAGGLQPGRGLESGPASNQDFYRGRLRSEPYYCQWELLGTVSQLSLLAAVDTIPFDMQDAWF
jgi:hypothetical protein